MSLLNALLPSLNAEKIDDIPHWSEEEAPWSILERGSSGLISQIEDLDLDDSGSFVHPSANIGEYVKIEAGCYIGSGVEVRHSAFIRRGSWVCEGSVIGHASEVKNSILLPGSKVPHFNYVGDSIIGFGANLGAGAKLSNVRNDRRVVLIETSDGRKIDSGLKKLGAIIGDGAQIGCNVVANPGTLVEPNAMINPNVTLSGYVFADTSRNK